MRALIFDGRVIELNDVGFPVSPYMIWVDVPAGIDVSVGWAYEDDSFFPPAADLQPDLNDVLADYRFEKESAGIEIAGVAVQTDRTSRIDLMAARTKASEDSAYSVLWKAQSGFVTLGAAQVILLADAVHDHVKICFEAEASVSGRIAQDEYETPEEVKEAFDDEYDRLTGE